MSITDPSGVSSSVSGSHLESRDRTEEGRGKRTWRWRSSDRRLDSAAAVSLLLIPTAANGHNNNNNGKNVRIIRGQNVCHVQTCRSLGGGRREEDGGDDGFEIVVLLLPHELSETTEMMDGDAADDVMEMDSHGTLRGASWPTAPAEDLQIAWENLDLARSIVSPLVEDDDDDAPLTPERRTDLLLDLAQIHARLGELQRASFAFALSISRTTHCSVSIHHSPNLVV